MTATTMPLAGLAGLVSPARSTAQSAPADEIVKMHEEIRVHLLTSYVISNATEQARKSLKAVRAEASFSGWNGYDALPLNPLAYYFAQVFLSALPTTAPSPEVSADPDGEVSFDWFFGERKALSISIGATGRCTFAWMLGQSTFRGTDWIEDEIPASIAFALGQLARSSTAQQTR
jgi:hypothetical protein